MESRTRTPEPGPEGNVTTLLDHLLDGIDPGVLSAHDLVSLRELRARYQEVESGLSLGRRLVQGRLDIVLIEQHRRQGGPGDGDGLIGNLPDALAQGTRGAGPARPMPDTEIPEFVEVIEGEAHRLLPAGDLARLDQVDDDRLDAAAASLTGLERRLSAKRRELHRIIDEIQDEIVGRYRSGSASVDDLLA